MFEEADVSRTVGWFTSLFPLFIDLSSARSELTNVVNLVKEQVRALPNRGANFGLLRYLCSKQHVKQAVVSLPRPEVSFNYIGQIDHVAGDYLSIAPNQTVTHLGRDLGGMRSHLIAVNGALLAGQLTFNWTFSTSVHRTATIEQLATSFIATLKELSATTETANASNYSPADFPDAGLSSEELETLLAELD
jgi:non-ribosomal peptide synthase protein (TIGR01720 family)